MSNVAPIDEFWSVMHLIGVDERIKIETRQFARKQIKWFDKEDVDITIDISEISNEGIFTLISQTINDF